MTQKAVVETKPPVVVQKENNIDFNYEIRDSKNGEMPWDAVARLWIKIRDPNWTTRYNSKVYEGRNCLEPLTVTHKIKNYDKIMPFKLHIDVHVAYKGSPEVWEMFHIIYDFVWAHDDEGLRDLDMIRKSCEYMGHANMFDGEPNVQRTEVT